MKKKTNVSVGKVVAVSAGVIALGSVAYYLLGKIVKSTRRKQKYY